MLATVFSNRSSCCACIIVYSCIVYIFGKTFRKMQPIEPPFSARAEVRVVCYCCVKKVEDILGLSTILISVCKSGSQHYRFEKGPFTEFTWGSTEPPQQYGKPFCVFHSLDSCDRYGRFTGVTDRLKTVQVTVIVQF